LVVGRYDILEFAVKAERPGYSEILLRVEPLADTGSPPVQLKQNDPMPNGSIVYATRVPITIRRDREKFSLRILATIFGLIIYMASGTVHQFLSTSGMRAFGTSPSDFPFAEKAIQLLGLGLVMLGFAGSVEHAIGTHEKLSGLSGGTPKSTIN
jgi:hypothetical protein